MPGNAATSLSKSTSSGSTRTLRSPPAAPHHPHQLHQHLVVECLRISHRLHRGLHPPDVAMMIGPQHINRPSEAALVLLPVIRDVGQQIGVRAIGLAEHPVLVVGERRGPEPQRAVLLVGVAPCREIVESLLQQPVAVQRRLEGDHVERDAELPQIGVLLGALRLDTDLPAATHTFGFREVREATSLAHENRRRELDQILAMIASLGDRRRDRKSTRLNSSHGYISYAVFCLKKKKNKRTRPSNSLEIAPVVVCTTRRDGTHWHTRGHPIPSLSPQAGRSSVLQRA